MQNRQGVAVAVGDKVYFMRGKERSEGFCTVLAVDPETKKLQLSPLPEGIQPGDLMVFEYEMDLATRKVYQPR